ncbi:hypothetical protein EVAR_88124_1 [Eumeta japonica]|uniref:Uncharacterized protein n=1 Tax=Eumeta variegata TaxID=151549 RepID=A0A4C1WQV7_EUMVA|nr:hypothetical protein EVAR_88124_1 [Eumeta japonica]
MAAVPPAQPASVRELWCSISVNPLESIIWIEIRSGEADSRVSGTLLKTRRSPNSGYETSKENIIKRMSAAKSILWFVRGANPNGNLACPCVQVQDTSEFNQHS